MKKSALLFLALAVVGCASNPVAPAPVFTMPPPPPDKADQTLLPLVEGNDWIYEYEATSYKGDKPTDTQSGELTFRTQGIEHVGDATRALLVVSMGDKEISRSTWEVGPTGIYQLSTGVHGEPLSSPEVIVKFPIDQTKTQHWTVSGNMPDGNEGTEDGVTSASKSPQIDTAVKTVAGIVSKTSVSYKTKQSTGTEVSTTWFEPNVGIVRLVQETIVNGQRTVTTLRLKSSILKH